MRKHKGTVHGNLRFLKCSECEYKTKHERKYARHMLDNHQIIYKYIQ